MKKFAIILLVSACALFFGCAYKHIGGIGASSRFSGIHVKIFANKTSRSGLETMVTQSLIDELAKHNAGNLVDEASAHFILSGTVLSYTVAPVSYTAADLIAGYRATLSLSATLTERDTGKVVWKGEMSGSQDYPVNADISLQQNSEAAAVVEISRRLAERIHENMQEDF